MPNPRPSTDATANADTTPIQTIYRGAMTIAAGLLLGSVLIYLGYGLFYAYAFGSADATDGPDAISGIAVYVDHGTGCHYLHKPPVGALTPRLDAEGDHICTGAAAAYSPDWRR